MPMKEQPKDTAADYLLPHGEPIALADIRDALIIKEGDLFLMTDVEGNIAGNSIAGYGLYKGDTRYLSVYDLTFDEIRPVVLMSTAKLGYSSEQHLTNPLLITADGKTIPKESLELRRQRVINESLLETIQVTNFNILRTTFNLRFEFDADFVDIFEVKGERRRRRGKLFNPVTNKNKVIFKYLGLDGVWRSMEMKFSPAPDQLWHNGAIFTISLGHRQSINIIVAITLDGIQSNGQFHTEFKRQTASYQEWRNSNTQIFTSNEFVNTILEQSINDIRLLMTNKGNRPFVRGKRLAR